MIEQIKYLLELKKNVIHRTKLSLAIELHFLVTAIKYLLHSLETQGLVESSRFSLTLPNLFLSVQVTFIIIILFFLFVFPPVWQLDFNISPTFFSFLLLPFLTLCHFHRFLPHRRSYPPSFLTARVTPHENVTAAILSYAVSHLHEGTWKLWKICADTVGFLTESVLSLTVSEKRPSDQRFDVQAANRRSPIQVLTQRKAA